MTDTDLQCDNTGCEHHWKLSGVGHELYFCNLFADNKSMGACHWYIAPSKPLKKDSPPIKKLLRRILRIG